MRLNHLALTVADTERSRRFYQGVLGFECSVREEDDGLLLTAPDGFVLGFLEGEPPEQRERVHFGFGLESADEVREMRRHLLGSGVHEVEWWELPEFVSTKVEDPDGYIVEIFWEEPA